MRENSNIFFLYPNTVLYTIHFGKHGFTEHPDILKLIPVILQKGLQGHNTALTDCGQIMGLENTDYKSV